MKPNEIPFYDTLPVSSPETLSSAEVTPSQALDEFDTLPGSANLPESGVRLKAPTAIEVSGKNCMPQHKPSEVAVADSKNNNVILSIKARGSVPTGGDENLPPFTQSITEEDESEQKRVAS
jgi:hypothetical protein